MGSLVKGSFLFVLAAMTEPHLNREEVERIAGRFAQARVCVLGDVMLDRYFWGSVDRISPEAPVPVVKVERRSARLGGAANVAANLKELGAQVLLFGVVGCDRAGGELRELLTLAGIGLEGIREDPERTTTEKVRIVAQNQQVVRADFEADWPIGERLKEILFESLASAEAQVLVVSDYAKGVVQEDYLRELISIWRSKGKKVLVDPNAAHFPWYRRATMVTPNTKEASHYFGLSPRGEKEFVASGFKMKNDLDLEALLITRGEDGMSLFLDSRRHLHVPTVAEDVYDVTGAGDTVISVLAAALGVGAGFEESVVMANRAAGEVVKEVGTSTLSATDLVSSFDEAN